MGTPGQLDTNTIHGPTKIERRGDDGTTIVFYSFPNEEETRNIRVGTEVQLSDAAGTRTEFIPHGTAPANDSVRQAFQDSFRQVEGIADVKFYDLQNLSDADREALRSNRVTIPATPDITIFRTTSQVVTFNAGLQPFVGEGEPPRRSDSDAPAKSQIEQVLSEDPARRAELEYVALHETLHNLGFRHTGKLESDPSKPALSQVADNAGNTVMSYNAYDNHATPFQPQTFQELDVRALQETYGVSKHPTPNLIENLAREEQEQATRATTTIPEYLQRKAFEESTLKKLEDFNDHNFTALTNVAAGHVFNAREIGSLLESDAQMKGNFSADELAFLQRRDPNLGSLTIRTLERHGDNTMVEINIQNDSSQFGYRPVVAELTPEAMRLIDERASEKAPGRYYIDPLNRGNHAPAQPEIKIPGAVPQIESPTPGRRKAEASPDGQRTDLASLNIPRIAFEGSNSMTDVPDERASSLSSRSTTSPQPRKGVSEPALG